MIRSSAVLGLVLGLTSGCASKGVDDPITGTWSNTACYGMAGMPDDIQSCTVSLAFSADLNVTLTESKLVRSANPTYPRCTITRRATGSTFATTPDMALTVSGSSTATMERSACVNGADNAAPVADTTLATPTGTFQYQITGNTLTLSTGPLAGMYTR